LAGVLGGNNNADAPELPASGAVAGVYTNPTLTVNSKGIITSISSGTSVDVYSIPLATTSSPGVVSVGSGLSINGSGVLSAPFATTSSLGVVKVGYGLTISAAGLLEINAGVYPQLEGGGAFTGAVMTQKVASSVSGGVALNFSQSNVFELTLAGNTTLNAPTNVTAGGVYFIVVKQDATGGRTLTFDSAFKFTSGSSSTVTATASAVDMLRVVALTSTSFLVTMYKNFV
jgi:hypothetical protein